MLENSLYVLLNLASAAALLIWSVRLVRTGFERAFGGQLRHWLRLSTSGRLSAAGCGAGAAILLQSSTAVAVLMAGFVSAGTIGAVAGLAILLGADLGSAIVTQLLNSSLSLVAPVLLLGGVVIFLRSSSRRLRQIGRILIGLALLFMSLDLIRAASHPLIESAQSQTIILYLADETAAAFLVAAIFAWLVHSSVAAVLLFVTMAGQGIMPVEATFAMVLGANLGGSFIALVLTLKSNVMVRRAVTANLVLRGGGAAGLLYVLSVFPNLSSFLGSEPAQQSLNLHLAFNGLLLILCLPLIGPIFRVASFIIRDSETDTEIGAKSSALDPAALSQPKRAFSCAVRELVHIGGRVEAMHRNVLPLFEHFDEMAARTIRSENEDVAQRSLKLRIYLASIRGKNAEDEIGTRAIELAGIAANLESAADMISRKMVMHAETMNLESLKFSKDGWGDLTMFHDTVYRNVQLSISVLMAEDPSLARSLVEQKETVREIAQRLEKQHLYRLKQGLSESIETSSIHLDLLRALKSVNTNFAMIAYPLLRDSGELLGSRLAVN
ncbi:phosphate:Na+ symporter [Jannaschia faecimaris]|uniref:Phosphate:Na+ symporter n=1 Tax=Jannaschia faecimaris TaxID=1244108 RepID=A0A1H3U2A4_9RHOB|nr:Na/Pi cotransporter family protein [Jannaschia faecimaris]SDZ56498.1 phosphate:Na+ symporter [Jannaschia faecimaris]